MTKRDADRSVPPSAPIVEKPPEEPRKAPRAVDVVIAAALKPAEAPPPVIAAPAPHPLADKLAELRGARTARDAVRLQVADVRGALEAAEARVRALHEGLLGELVTLTGGDLADNFVYLSDADGEHLETKARDAKQGLAQYVRAKLLG